MPNKLKDIFTKEPLERKIRFEFFDEKDYLDRRKNTNRQYLRSSGLF